MNKDLYKYICTRNWPQRLTWSLVERLDTPVPYYVLVFFADTFNGTVLTTDELVRIPSIINDIMYKASLDKVQITIAKEPTTPIGHTNG